MLPIDNNNNNKCNSTNLYSEDELRALHILFWQYLINHRLRDCGKDIGCYKMNES